MNLFRNIILMSALAIMSACSAKGTTGGTDRTTADDAPSHPAFSTDSAMTWLKTQVDFGPRVPNTEAHRQASQWLASELRRHGAEVILQPADLKAFDGTILKATNIMGRYNPAAERRILLLAHWDCRPWADKDPDPANHKRPVDGANDGASGVAVLLELARLFSLQAPQAGVDILFVDAEDWGDEGDEDSWAMGARHFIENPPLDNYAPYAAVLLDMVGGKDARFCAEYFSLQSAPDLLRQVWSTAESLGYGEYFPLRHGGAVTDDHVQLIAHGVPAIDIIDFRPESESGFPPQWHTVSDTYENIDPATIRAVGETMAEFIYSLGE